MQIFYMNDEKRAVTIQVNGQLRPSPHNKFGEPSMEYFVLEPGESKTFFVDAPKDSIPYVKRWENRFVLLTYLPQRSVEEIQSKLST